MKVLIVCFTLTMSVWARPQSTKSNSAIFFPGTLPQIFVPSTATTQAQAPKLPKPEPCPNDDLFCSSENGFPLDQIQKLIHEKMELMGDGAREKYFGSKDAAVQIRTGNLDNTFACSHRKEYLPRFTRAKNNAGEYVYLAQMSTDIYQEVEVAICNNGNGRCLADIDSPHGEDSTVCKQLFTTRKLLAVHEKSGEGEVTIDTFDLPSGCVCKTKLRKTGTGPEIFVRNQAEPLKQKEKEEERCTKDMVSVPLHHDRFDRGQSVDDETPDNTTVEKLKNDANMVSPICGNSSSRVIFEDDNGDNVDGVDDEQDLCEDEGGYYPEAEINQVLGRHYLFQSKEFFGKIFNDPPKCEKPEELNIRSGAFDVNEVSLCESHERIVYPKRAKNVDGKVKYIVNTSDYRQGVSIVRCLRSAKGRSCKYGGSEGKDPDRTACRQLYHKHNLLSLNDDGSVDFDLFPVPSSCACELLDGFFHGNELTE